MGETRPLLLSPEQAAERLAVGRTTVYALIASGELETVRVGRSRRVVAESTDAFVTKLRAEQGQQAAS